MTGHLSVKRGDTWQRIAGWFLLLSYVVGSPAFSIVEMQTAVVSERFGYPPEFLYLVAFTQLVCGSVLFVRFLAPWSCGVLTILSIGAVVSHFRIGSPLTSLPAVAYSVIQIWYGIRVYANGRRQAKQ